jgi:hypothetical protein
MNPTARPGCHVHRRCTATERPSASATSPCSGRCHRVRVRDVVRRPRLAADERGGTAADVGWLAAVYTAPVIIGGRRGVIPDRFDARRVIAADNVIRGVAVASVPIGSARASMTAQLFVVAAIYGLLFMTSIAGIPTLIPRVVGSGISRRNAMESISLRDRGPDRSGARGCRHPPDRAPVVLALDAATYAVCRLPARDACGASARRRPAAGADEARAPAPVERGRSRHRPSRPIHPRCAGDRGDDRMYSSQPQRRDHDRGHPDPRATSSAAARRRSIAPRARSPSASSRAVDRGRIDWRWPLGRSIAIAALVSGLIPSLWLLRPGLRADRDPAASGLVESSLTPWAQTIRMRLSRRS